MQLEKGKNKGLSNIVKKGVIGQRGSSDLVNNFKLNKNQFF